MFITIKCNMKMWTIWFRLLFIGVSINVMRYDVYFQICNQIMQFDWTTNGAQFKCGWSLFGDITFITVNVTITTRESWKCHNYSCIVIVVDWH